MHDYILPRQDHLEDLNLGRFRFFSEGGTSETSPGGKAQREMILDMVLGGDVSYTLKSDSPKNVLLKVRLNVFRSIVEIFAAKIRLGNDVA